MDIIWHGHSCFTIKGENATIVTDPYNGLGTKLPKLTANIVSVGDKLAETTGELAPVEGDPKVLDWPGEFEVSGVSIEAFSADRHAKEGGLEGENVNLFVFAIDGIKVCHLSGLAHDLSDELLERIGDIDVLLLPVGGAEVLDAKVAQSVMDSIEPRVVIPMYTSETPTNFNIGGPEEFLKLVGKTELAAEAKYSVKGRSALPGDQTEFVRLEPKL